MVLKFIKKLGLFLPMLLAIAIFNCGVDPAYLFKPDRYEKNLADLLLQKRDIVAVTNHNERVLQKFYINGLMEKKDIVILGSSRTFAITHEMFPGKSFFNSSVSGAVLEDFMGIYELYRKKKLLPKVLLIDLDPWLLNKNNSEARWQFLDPEYNELAKTAKIDARPVSNFMLRKYIELLSPSYLQSAVRVFKKTHRFFTIEGGEEVFDKQIKSSDGSIGYSEYLLELSESEVLPAAQAYAQFNVPYHLSYFTTLNTKAMENFEKFISLVQSDGVKVIFFLPAYHPVAYDILINDKFNRNIIDAQKFFEEVGRRQGIKVIGSYNPKDCGLTQLDFVDAMHTRPYGLKRIFENNHVRQMVDE